MKKLLILFMLLSSVCYAESLHERMAKANGSFDFEAYRNWDNNKPKLPEIKLLDGGYARFDAAENLEIMSWDGGMDYDVTVIYKKDVMQVYEFIKKTYGLR